MGNFSPSLIVCFGNSITEGYLVPQSCSYPAVLSRLSGINCINLGISGDTSSNGLNRLTQLDGYLSKDQDVLVLLEFGINDFFTGMAKRDCEANLFKLIEHVLSAGHNPVLLGFDMDYPGVRNWISLYSQLANEFSIPLYPNIFKGLSKSQGDFFPDGLHPSQTGYFKLASGVFDFLKRHELIKT